MANTKLYISLCNSGDSSVKWNRFRVVLCISVLKSSLNDTATSSNVVTCRPLLAVCCVSVSVEENSRTIMKKAARAVDSLSDTEFNISFNPDLFQPHVAHAQTEVGVNCRPGICHVPFILRSPSSPLSLMSVCGVELCWLQPSVSRHLSAICNSTGSSPTYSFRQSVNAKLVHHDVLFHVLPQDWPLVSFHLCICCRAQQLKSLNVIKCAFFYCTRHI